MRRLCGLVLGLPALAFAGPSAELVREFQAGVDAYRLGKLAEARDHLDRAHALDPELPGPERYLAAVAQAEGRWQDCIDAARLALRLNPASAELAETRKLHAACRASAGRAPYRGELGDSAAIAVASSVPGATVMIRGLGFGATPLPPHRINPGALEITIEKPGYHPAHLQIDALPGIVTDVQIELDPDPDAATPQPIIVPPPHPRPAQGCCDTGSGAGTAGIALALVALVGRRRRHT